MQACSAFSAVHSSTKQPGSFRIAFSARREKKNHVILFVYGWVQMPFVGDWTHLFSSWLLDHLPLGYRHRPLRSGGVGGGARGISARSVFWSSLKIPR